LKFILTFDIEVQTFNIEGVFDISKLDFDIEVLNFNIGVARIQGADAGMHHSDRVAA
jgi:hypothetical protein